MQMGFKTRCYPGPKLAQVLAQWIGCQRVASNAKHEELHYLLWLRKRAITSPSWTDPDPQGSFPLDQTFSQYKDAELSPWLSEVPAQIIRNGVVLYKRGWSNRFKNPAHFGTPTRKRKWDRNSVWLTSELFRFVGKGWVELGTVANPIGRLRFVQHQDLGFPKSITLTRKRFGHWFLSCSQELEGPELAKAEDRLVALSTLPLDTLETQVLGIDRGIVFNAACSDGVTGQLSDAQKEEMRRLQSRRRRFQRAAARGVLGSRRRDKNLAKAAKCVAKIASIRNDFLRKITFQIAELPQTIVALEDLNLKGMSRKAKPKKDEAGNYVKNNAAQKTGLNKALANAGLGNFSIYLKQALVKRGKLFIDVPAHYSSQECSVCGYIDKDNRPNQETFICLHCGHEENADINASKVIKKRGIALIKSCTAGMVGSARLSPKSRPTGRGTLRRNSRFAVSNRENSSSLVTEETPPS